MTEYRDKMKITAELTAGTTAERLEHIRAKKLVRGKVVYTKHNKVPYVIVGFTGPEKQWVLIRPDGDSEANTVEMDPRQLSTERPAKPKKGNRGRHG